MGIGVRILLALALILGISGTATAQELQSGDVLEITVYQDPKLNRQVVVGPTGMISFPLAGHLQAGGLSAQALEKSLRARLRSKFTGDLDITVAVVSRDETQKPRIYVTGEVQRPGPHIISARTTVLQAISLAGGLSPFAAKQRIQVVRKIDGVEEILVFNYRAFESGQDLSGNIDLRAGDVIIVPERGLFE
jgi:polysaccharide biosynthesis/export protein